MPSPDKVRFPFLTQRPREDGCGVFVLQMLTGLSYEQIADMIDWGDETIHRSTWQNLIGVLGQLGWEFTEPHAVNGWGDVQGVAIVHVMDDHFMMYDADEAVFYDPWEWEGPSSESARVPLSYLKVRPPTAAS